VPEIVSVAPVHWPEARSWVVGAGGPGGYPMGAGAAVQALSRCRAWSARLVHGDWRPRCRSCPGAGCQQPAAKSSRRRSRLGSHRRAWWPCRASICIQAVISQARATAAPDLVLGEVVEREIAQAGVLRGADPVLAPGAAAVPQLEVGQLGCRARRCGCRRERGDAVAPRKRLSSWRRLTGCW
jgi:hypothetical protein